jgi:pyrophosphatase PpaX
VSAGFDPILFDLDGTVVDTVELIRESHRYATRTVLGADFSDERLVANVGKPLLEQMVSFSPDHADELYRVYREWNHAHTADLIAAYAGIDELLEQLASDGRRMALVTSKSRDAVDLAFRSLPVGRHFDIVVTADDSSRHKPDPEPILLALERLGAGADRACYVGDSPFDIEAGNRAGLVTIAVTWGFFGREDLDSAEPDLTCTSTDELGRVLRGTP